MLKRTEMRALAFVLGAATVVACSEGATAPDDATSASDVLLIRGGKGGGGGKPAGDSGGAATTLNMRTRTPGDGTGVYGDDGGPYVDGTARITVTLTDKLSVRTFSGNAKQQERAGSDVRKLCFNLSALTPVPNSGDLADFKIAAGGDLSDFCSRVAMETRNEDPALNSLGVGGVTALAGGKIVLQDLDVVRGAWDWRIIFDTPWPPAVDGEVRPPAPPGYGEGLCVERVDATTWRFFNHDDDDIAIGCLASNGTRVDIDVELWRFNDGDPKMVAEFNMPFSFTVTSG